MTTIDRINPLAHLLRSAAAALVAALLAPLVMAAWVAAAPLRFVMAITTEPEWFDSREGGDGDVEAAAAEE